MTTHTVRDLIAALSTYREDAPVLVKARAGTIQGEVVGATSTAGRERYPEGAAVVVYAEREGAGTSDTLTNLLTRAQSDLNTTRNKLAREARDLGEELLRLADRLWTDDDYRPSIDGVIRGRASPIDTMCARLGAERERLEWLQYLASEGREAEP